MNMPSFFYYTKKKKAKQPGPRIQHDIHYARTCGIIFKDPNPGTGNQHRFRHTWQLGSFGISYVYLAITMIPFMSVLLQYRRIYIKFAK